MDAFDLDNTYQLDVSRRVLQSELLLQSLCAFSARQLSLKAGGSYWIEKAPELYVKALQLLIAALDADHDHEEVLAASIFLNSYEVIGPGGEDHERHYRGAASILKLYNISASSKGLDRASFWIFVRHDIWIALTEERQMEICPLQWNVRRPHKNAREDHKANYVLWLVARAINLLYLPSCNDVPQQVVEELDLWYRNLGRTFKGIEVRASNGRQQYYFTVPAASQCALAGSV